MNLFARDMERLTGATLELAALVEEMIRSAIRSLCDRDAALAQQVVRGDAVIDQMEVLIEADCLRILALHDPVAGDLRRVVAVLKINNELERIADLAVSMAQRALDLAADASAVPIPEDLETMAERAAAMVRGSLDALVAGDARRAREVIAQDDGLDHLHRRVIGALKALMRARPEWLDAGLGLFAAAAHLERIGDHATNIAEEVVYLAEGTIIRHHRGEAAPARRGRAPTVRPAPRRGAAIPAGCPE